MAEAERGDAPRHSVQVHRRAQTEMQQLRGEYDIADLEAKIDAAARERQPKNARPVEAVEGSEDLLKLRGDGIRALLALAPPALLVLLVDKRRVVYDRLAVAEARLSDWEGMR